MDPNNRCCGTCKHHKDYFCEEINVKLTDYHIEEFVCDFYKRKNSGAFRRKLKKHTKELKGENNE